MPVRLFMDHHVPRAITTQLRLRSVDVLTAAEDGSSTFDDRTLLDRAATLGRVLFTHDDDLLSEAARRQERGQAFAGVVYAHQRHVSIGQCVHDLEMPVQAGEPDDMMGNALYLPL